MKLAANLIIFSFIPKFIIFGNKIVMNSYHFYTEYIYNRSIPMKNRILHISVVATLFSVVFLQACMHNFYCEQGSKNIINRKMDFSGFRKVVVEGNGNVFISQGDTDSLLIETDDNIIPLVRPRLDGDILYIDTDCPVCPTKFNVYLTMKEFNGFKIEGSGCMKAKTPINTDHLILTIAGSGDISIPELKAKNIKGEIFGSGNMSLSGVTEKIYIEIAGSGDAYCESLEASSVKVEISGSGDCSVMANDDLYVYITGSGDVLYKGSPSNYHTSVSGSGKVKPKK